MPIKTTIIFLLFFSVTSFAQDSTIKLQKISPNVFVHESFLETKDWGKVSCNGMVLINEGEAIIFDTPANELATKNLIAIIQDSLKAKVVAVVVNHFHEDCLGGLSVFHELNIASYANERTIALAKANGFEVPKNGFVKKMVLKAGGIEVKNFYFGAAHTCDNIVSYIPKSKVLFGGCMVKALGASKGNLADADITQWSNTIQQVMKLKPEIVIPGHGKVGGAELLDYTEKLFKLN